MEDIKVIREEFKKYLYKQVTDNKLSKVDADTQYSDADYPRKHADELGINYWESFRDDISLENLLSILKERITKEGKNPSTIVSYKRALKNFKIFIDENGDKYAINNHAEINYYWVCQSQNYKNEKNEKSLIAPDTKSPHRQILKKLKVGDKIISYNKNKGIQAILDVTKAYYIDDKNNIIVNVNYNELSQPIVKVDFVNNIKKHNINVFYKNSPIDKNYNINTGYCFKISKEFYNATLNQDAYLNNYKKSEVNMDKFPKNLILYGPPGTGKTYNTVLKAMSIINNTDYKDVSEEQYSTLKTRFDELKQAGQIEFVTFHQSYSYEEFVEGIKPYIPEWGTIDNADVKYIGENGIFKEICKNARQIKTDKTSHKIDFSKTRIFKMSLGANWENETEDIYNYCLTNNVVALGWGDDKDFSSCNTSEEFRNLDSTWGAKAVEIFKNWMRVGDIILISNGNSNIKAIAQITGEYEYHNDREIRYCQFRNVNWLYNGDDIPVAKFYEKKLSQQTIYGFYNKDKEGKDDYNSSINTNVLNEIITGNINSAEEKPYILIIDEINRGDVSKIFGELITLIEEDKRIGNKYQMKTILPYSKESFGVPNNLYIIGTMNTADRSIALLDTALRRRFDFEEIMPRPELLGGKVVEGINLQTLLTRINERITNKYDRDHQIGHSYLMGVNTKEQLERAYKNRILPLLNEYFYNESKTVAEILNCSEDELKTSDFISILGKAQGA